MIRLAVSLISLFFVSCAPVSYTGQGDSGSENTLQLADRVYENTIKTVRLFPGFPHPMAQTQPAVTRMGEWNMILEFDDLHSSRDSYYFRIIHCNQDWTKSTLMDLDFLFDYNEFPINQFEFSLDTWLPYVHYWINLPPVKLPGNYVVVVYRGSDRDAIVLSKRFMVYDHRITFSRSGQQISSGMAAMQNQQINFTINYRNLELINPLETVNVTIRQNQRWDNQVREIKPSFVRDNVQELEYRFITDSELLKGGNEFRFFDLRSLNYPGRNISFVDKSTIPWNFYVEKDKSRAGDAYSQYPDYNGSYVIDNYDYRRTNAANYATVTFTLSSPEPVPGDVHVVGAFSNWHSNASNKMKYDSSKAEYSSSVLLKQGWYDYQYIVRSKTIPYHYFEGNYFQTENLYEVFVYYRSFQPLADLLIGYVRFEENPR